MSHGTRLSGHNSLYKRNLQGRCACLEGHTNGGSRSSIEKKEVLALPMVDEKTKKFDLRRAAVSLLAVIIACACAITAHAENDPPSNGLSLTAKNFFEKGIVNRFKFLDENLKAEVVNLDESHSSEETANKDEKAEPKAAEPPEDEDESSGSGKQAQIVFVSEDPASHIRPPDEDVPVRLNPEAPGPLLGLHSSIISNDIPLAERYADQLVRYEQKVIFLARFAADLIGEAMVRQGLIDEEEYIGAWQLRDYTDAKARELANSPIRPTHEEAMRRIVPDSENRAHIYYFFTLNCSWCRFMAPDVERLYLATKNDPNVRIVALTLGATPEDWVEEYRAYTGIKETPIMEGADYAKGFRVAFVPAIVVVAPSTAGANGKPRAYLRAGQMGFDRIYEFVRSVQGLPATMTPEIQRIMNRAIGEAEIQQARLDGTKSIERPERARARFAGPVRTITVKDSMDKF